jgi:hypothetical protein
MEVEIARLVMGEARNNMLCLTQFLSCTVLDGKGSNKFLLNDRTRAAMAQAIDDNLVVLNGAMAKLS